MRSVTLDGPSVSNAVWILYEGEFPNCCGDFSYSSPSPAFAYVADGTGHNFQGEYQLTRAKMAKAWDSFNQDLKSQSSDNIDDLEALFVDRIKQLSNDFENIGKSSTLSFAWFVDTPQGSELSSINLGDSAIFLRRSDTWVHVQGHNDDTSDYELPYDTYHLCPKIIKNPISENDVAIGITDGVIEALSGFKAPILDISDKLNEVIGDAKTADEIKDRLFEYTKAHIPDENPDDSKLFCLSLDRT